MKATGHFEQVKDVDPLVVLNDHTRSHIDHWVSKFPPDRKRSALIQSLMAAQEQNVGYLTDELITAVAKYLELPAIWAYEVASFYSMFETTPVGRNNVAKCLKWLRSNGKPCKIIGTGIVRHYSSKIWCRHLFPCKRCKFRRSNVVYCIYENSQIN
ncbi:MAG: NAD(P)H-dependent oxidoreductase subunit E [Arachidicoccus sp.]|nr:NAD(P)H-dependent oxidoreductase subunit E [Arachidicoccus sp.]